MEKCVGLLCVAVMLAGFLWGQEDPAKKQATASEKKEVSRKKLSDEEIRRQKLSHSSYKLGSKPVKEELNREERAKKLRKD